MITFEIVILKKKTQKNVELISWKTALVNRFNLMVQEFFKVV